MPNKLKQEQDEKFSYHDEEIDLRYVIDRIGNGIHAISAKIRYIIHVIQKRFILVLLLTLLGAAFGYYRYTTVRPYYTSSMTLMLANIRNDFIEDQLNKLSIMVLEENFEAVADRLDISTEAASKIKLMRFINLDVDRIEEDSILTGSPFRVELSLYDRNMFGAMEPALTNYLENNRYFAKQKRIKQRQVESIVSKLKNEISSIDSMKTNVSEPRGPVNGFVYGQPIDPTNLYKESISMYKEQVKLEADLERLDNVEIVTGFAPRLYPSGPSLVKHLALGGLIAFTISMAVALRLESRSRAR